MDQTCDCRAKLIRHHPCVIFNSSSTVYEAAYQVVEKGLKLTAVTNDIRIGELLAGNGANGFHPTICNGGMLVMGLVGLTPKNEGPGSERRR